MITRKQATIAAICYADVFDFPLTIDECTLWLPYTTQVQFSPAIQKKDSFLFLSGKTNLIAKRRKRSAANVQKFILAKQVATVLGYIPTVALVGVTGGVAMDNAKEEDDIDLFFILTDKTVWITRLFILLIVEVLGRRRRRGETQVKNRICLNMFLSDAALHISPNEQDLYSAHEILQMRPICDRDGTYKKFLLANKWVRRFLPNAWKEKLQMSTLINDKGKHGDYRNFLHDFWYWVSRFFEPIARLFQLFHMRKYRTTEVVSDSVLRFHPKDARVWVIRKLRKRFTRYNIPLDNIFYGR